MKVIGEIECEDYTIEVINLGSTYEIGYRYPSGHYEAKHPACSADDVIRALCHYGHNMSYLLMFKK